MRFSRLLPMIAALSSACSSGPDVTKCQVGAKTAGATGCFGVAVDGDPNACAFSGTGDQAQSVCDRFCGGDAGTFACSYNGDAGAPMVECVPGAGLCTGRRPSGFRSSPAGELTLGGSIAALAELEGASIAAFAILRDELVRFDAPAALAQRARRAMRDEARHARIMSSLARSFGGAPRAHVVASPRRRSLFEIALENAIEGCVRETYGAAVGAWQARHAPDARVRRAFLSVAADEARHADLAWDVHTWAMARLQRADRVAISDAMARAIDDIEATLVNPPAELAALGLPNVADARAMLAVLREHLWARPRAA